MGATFGWPFCIYGDESDCLLIGIPTPNAARHAFKCHRA